MFAYRKPASIGTNPNHLTCLADNPELREEDISFYGLLTLAMQRRVLDLQRLPGRANGSFEFTDRDRGIARMALRTAGLRPVTSYLEVCVISEEYPELVASNFFTLGGSTKHGLQIITHSLGVCSLPAEKKG